MTWAAGYLYILASAHSRLTLPIGLAQVSTREKIVETLLWHLYLLLKMHTNVYISIKLQKAICCFQMCCLEKKLVIRNPFTKLV